MGFGSRTHQIGLNGPADEWPGHVGRGLVASTRSIRLESRTVQCLLYPADMRPRLFHTLVFMGATLTGTVGLVVVPAALGLTACGSPQHFVFIDMSASGFIDMFVLIDMYAGPPPDFANADAGDAGTE
jgi:hypothetical protein